MSPIIGDPDELTTAIRHMARSEVLEIRRKAEQKADRIKTEAQQEAERVREEILADARSRAKDIRKQRKVKLGRKEMGEYLRERESILDDIWEQAEDRLSRLIEDDEAYSDVLHRLALAAAPAIGPGEAIVASDEKGHRLLTDERLKFWGKEASKELPGEIAFKRADDPLQDSWGGLVLMDKDGRLRIDMTFAARLYSAREEIREQVFSRVVTS